MRVVLTLQSKKDMV